LVGLFVDIGLGSVRGNVPIINNEGFLELRVGLLNLAKLQEGLS